MAGWGPINPRYSEFGKLYHIPHNISALARFIVNINILNDVVAYNVMPTFSIRNSRSA